MAPPRPRCPRGASLLLVVLPLLLLHAAPALAHDPSSGGGGVGAPDAASDRDEILTGMLEGKMGGVRGAARPVAGRVPADVCPRLRVMALRLDGLGVQVTSQIYAAMLAIAERDRGLCYVIRRPKSIHHWRDYGGATMQESIDSVLDFLGWMPYVDRARNKRGVKSLGSSDPCHKDGLIATMRDRQQRHGCGVTIDLGTHCPRTSNAQQLEGARRLFPLVGNALSSMLFAESERQRRFQPLFAIPPDGVVVAVHVRRGDVLTEKKAFHRNRATPLANYVPILKAFRAKFPGVQFHVLSQGSPADFKEISAPDVTLHLNENALLSYKGMVEADYLVTGSSTFSWSAAVLRVNNETVVTPQGMYYNGRFHGWHSWFGPRRFQEFVRDVTFQTVLERRKEFRSRMIKDPKEMRSILNMC